MRIDVIKAVIDAIERQEPRHLGFNMLVYAATADERCYHDHIGGKPYVADIAGWTATLFTREGLRRAKPLAFTDLYDLTMSQNMVDYLAQAFDIHQEQAIALIKPGAAIDALSINANEISHSTMLMVLRDLVRTGDVELPIDVFFPEQAA